MVFSPPGTLRSFPESVPPSRPIESTILQAHSNSEDSSFSRKFKIVIGNKAYSSWSLRAWLALRHAVDPSDFTEVLCPLAGADATEDARAAAQRAILVHSPTGKVPALIDHALNVTVYESLAIVLHLAERYPSALLLPTDPAARAACLSACAEMHAGFGALRANLPMNCPATARRHGEDALQRPDVRRDIDRICALWAHLLERYGKPAAAAAAASPAASTPGPYLFGHFSAADCMFAPVALRFRTYDPNLKALTPAAAAYAAALCAHPAVEEWVAAARAEGPELRIAAYDAIADAGGEGRNPSA